jgi:hypothetical protein
LFIVDQIRTIHYWIYEYEVYYRYVSSGSKALEKDIIQVVLLYQAIYGRED